MKKQELYIVVVVLALISMSGCVVSKQNSPEANKAIAYVMANEEAFKPANTKKGLVGFEIEEIYYNVYEKTVVEMYQTYNNIPVHGTKKYIHINQEGNIDFVVGEFVSYLERANGLNEVIKLDAATAITIAREATKSIGYSKKNYKAKLYVLPNQSTQDAKYIYETRSGIIWEQAANWICHIDAITGEVIMIHNDVIRD